MKKSDDFPELDPICYWRKPAGQFALNAQAEIALTLDPEPPSEHPERLVDDMYDLDDLLLCCEAEMREHYRAKLYDPGHEEDPPF